LEEAKMPQQPDPEIEALSKVCSALAALESDDVRQRVLEFASSKFGLRPAKATKEGEFLSDKRDNSSEDEKDDDLLSRFDTKKPAENVMLLVARHYSRYGGESFTAADLRDEAARAGLTVPARIDMTLNQGGRKGKKFFQSLGRGAFRVTVHGETFLKETYQVKKGRQKRETPSEVSE
jgi:hypothetical protein